MSTSSSLFMLPPRRPLRPHLISAPHRLRRQLSTPSSSSFTQLPACSVASRTLLCRHQARPSQLAVAKLERLGDSQQRLEDVLIVDVAASFRLDPILGAPVLVHHISESPVNHRKSLADHACRTSCRISSPLVDMYVSVRCHARLLASHRAPPRRSLITLVDELCLRDLSDKSAILCFVRFRAECLRIDMLPLLSPWVRWAAISADVQSRAIPCERRRPPRR